MKKFFFLFISGVSFTIFLFIIVPARLSGVYAVCQSDWGEYNYTAATGALVCYDHNLLNPFNSNIKIKECLPDGTWNYDYYDCSVENDTCVREGTAPNFTSRCKNSPAAPTPTPNPNILPDECSGGYTVTQTKCENNRKMRCDLDLSTPNPLDVRWVIAENSCMLCTENPKGYATCGSEIPSPTPTPTAEPTIAPTLTQATCELNGRQYNLGSKACSSQDVGAYTRGVIMQCVQQADPTIANWTLRVGECAIGDPCQVVMNEAPLLDVKCRAETLSPTPTPLPEDNPEKCSYAAPEGQQVMPRPGVNCGVPENEVTGTMDQNAKYCCSSSLTKEELVSLACFIRIPGGQSFLEGLSKTINENLNNFPFVFLDSTAAENVNLPNFKGFREGLEKIDPCMSGTMLDGSGDSPGSPGCRCLRPQAGNSLAAYCDRISADNPAEILECKKCMLKLDASNNPIPGEAGNGIWTALGCIDISSEGGFVQGLLSLGVSLGGAFAILCNIYAAFLLQTSAGNPERINKARSLIISCVTGLLLIIFSIFILNLIGYRILRIPGLGP